MNDATAAVGALQEITLQGKMYRIGEITLGDMAELEAKAKAKYRELRKEKMAMAVEAYGQAKVPADVFRICVAEITQDQIDAEAETLEGTAYLLWKAMQRANPEITEVQVRSLMTVKDIPDVLDAMGLKADSKITEKEAREMIAANDVSGILKALGLKAEEKNEQPPVPTK